MDRHARRAHWLGWCVSVPAPGDVKTRLFPSSSVTLLNMRLLSLPPPLPVGPNLAEETEKPPSPHLLSGCFVPSVPAAQCDIYGFLLGACAEAAIIPAAQIPLSPRSLDPVDPI